MINEHGDGRRHGSGVLKKVGLMDVVGEVKGGLAAHGMIIGRENSSAIVLLNIEESGAGVKSAEGS